MKRIVFLIIATLLVLGLVLPGCGDGNGVEFENWVTIGVAGPMGFIQGRDHWAGATMAAEEINDAGGVTVGTTVYGIALEKVDTNEILDISGVDGTTALTAVIDKVDFVVGGFRTEALVVYREVAVGPGGAGVIFMNSGAATAALQMSVVQDYDNYKYWFKATPYNEVFLVTSCLKMTAMVNTVLRTYAGLGVWPGDPTQLRLAVMMEDAEWSNPMLPYVQGFCAAYGINYTGMQNCESSANDLSTELLAIAADDPHMVFTILSGPPGKAYGAQQATYLPNTFSVGINVEGQDIDYQYETGAEYHVSLDTWAEDVALTSKTLAWLEDFMDRTGRYPTYCAATYDAIYSLKAAVEATDKVPSSTGGNDAIIQYLETHCYMGVGANTGYYPMPAITLAPYDPPTEPGTWALNITQVQAIYPDYDPVAFNHTVLGPAYGPFEGLVCNTLIPYTGLPGRPEFTTTAGFIAHDTVYGPGYQTGQGAQWQPDDPENLEGAWSKVGWWPMPLGEGEPYDTLLTDVYGNWNFEYTGAVDLVVPLEWIAEFGAS